MNENARERILAKIEKNLAQNRSGTRNLQKVGERLKNHPRGIIPGRSRQDIPTTRKIFRDMLEKAGATFETLATIDEIPQKTHLWLKHHNMPSSIRIPHDPAIQALNWQPLLEVKSGVPDKNDHTAIIYAHAGIAETGTLIMLSGEKAPVTANFLPENHLVILDEETIYGAYEEIWDSVRERMPRSVNMITGPSRTGDIEQTLIMGAHGPKKLHVFILRKKNPK